MVAIAELPVASHRCTKTETQPLVWAITSKDKAEDIGDGAESGELLADGLSYHQGPTMPGCKQ